jgi:hypothetical protein
MNPSYRRLAWFAGIYLLSIGAYLLLALAVRLVLRFAS